MVRKPAEESRWEIESQFRTLFDHAPVGILYFDRHGVMTSCNDRLVEMNASTREKLIGLRLLELPDPQAAQAVIAALNGKTGAYCGSYHSYTADKVTYIRGNFSPIFAPDGTVMGGVGIIEDISEQKKSELLRHSLYKIGDATNSAKTLEELYCQIHEIIKSLLPSKNFYIALWDQATDLVSFPYFVDEFDPTPETRKFGAGLTEYVLRTGKPLLARSEVLPRLRLSGSVDHVGTPCVDWLGVPLKNTNKKVLGVVVVQSYDEEVRYTEQDASILEYVSTQIANAIQRRMAEEAEHQQRLMAEALLDTTSAIGSSLELEEVFDRILVNLEKLSPFDSANIMLIQDDIAKIYCHRGRPEVWKEMSDTFRWWEIHSFHQIYETGRPLIIEDTSQYGYWLPLEGTLWIRSFAGVPLLTKGQVIGFLNLNSEKVGFFHPENSAVKLQVFATQAAKAIENARLYAEVQRLSVIDDLTGLYNRRGLSQLGRLEVERANRFDRPLSILFMDIDHFKQFNDQYSYAVGDQVLGMFADCLRSHLREIDIISRYGGDEFVALLPEVDNEVATRVAERLLQQIRSLCYEHEGAQLTITSSIGVYTARRTRLTLESLVTRAGSQLQKAKKNGRNQVFSN